MAVCQCLTAVAPRGACEMRVHTLTFTGDDIWVKKCRFDRELETQTAPVGVRVYQHPTINIRIRTQARSAGTRHRTSDTSLTTSPTSLEDSPLSRAPTSLEGSRASPLQPTGARRASRLLTSSGPGRRDRPSHSRVVAVVVELSRRLTVSRAHFIFVRFSIFLANLTKCGMFWRLDAGAI